MSRKRKFFQSVLIIGLVLACSASTAAAQDAPPSSELTSWATVDVTAHKEQAGEVLIISGELPEKTPLPARVELAVPSGSQLRWIGEILGGDPSADPELEYEVIPSGDYDVYRFTLTQSRIAQIEVVPARPAVAFDGSVYSANVSWKPSQDVPELHMSVTLPPGAQVQQPDEGAAIQTQANNSRYLKEFTGVAAEETATLEFTYIAPEGVVSGGTEPASGGSEGATGLLLLIAGAGLGAGGMLLWRKMQQSTDRGDRPESRGPSHPKDRSKPASGAMTADRTRSTDVKGLSPRAKLIMVAAALIGGALVFMIVASGDVGTVKTTDTGVTKVLTSAEADQSLSVPGQFQSGGDIQHEATHVFDVLEGVAGVSAVTVSLDGSTIGVDYASSIVSGEAITSMLEASGYVAPSSPPAGGSQMPGVSR